MTNLHQTFILVEFIGGMSIIFFNIVKRTGFNIIFVVFLSLYQFSKSYNFICILSFSLVIGEEAMLHIYMIFHQLTGSVILSF